MQQHTAAFSALNRLGPVAVGDASADCRLTESHQCALCAGGLRCLLTVNPLVWADSPTPSHTTVEVSRY